MENYIVLLRHAATTGGKGRAIGRTPLALSEEGQQQAASLVESLPRLLARLSGNRTGRSFAAVYSSPASRALDTLAPQYGQMAQGRFACLPQATILPELDEIDLGEWDGLAFEDIRSRFPQAYAMRGRDMAGFRPPGGENFRDVDARMQAAMTRMATGPLPALAVTHAGCIRTVLCRCTATPLDALFSFSPPHARPYVIELSCLPVRAGSAPVCSSVTGGTLTAIPEGEEGIAGHHVWQVGTSIV
ncbi:histidine phosphatase family protein [Desulfovibrio subterraneus]|uniref:histidine phosphatase family protein n=1 Tax=Desulfovibrio subterraneus TaxID=2718620 RepID=UPI0022B908ED|nr:histidine phosphatase family protein [Desulfovibrio subterraneus]WBF65981.1 histidine phosphatase family protein [Desulfovibrio subterraneus]